MNRRIRAAILADIRKNGAGNTRRLNSVYSKLFHTTKQRISGNISYLVTSGTVSIVRNRPNSYIF